MSADLRTTYRVQLQPGFTLDDAAAITNYLSGLGVTHLYCSPYLQAVPGSQHGYDVVNPHQVNQELGGAEAHARLVGALEQQGMGQVLDIVPNHMAIAGPENPWWWDVLENGPSSPYASYFDVEWDPPEARHSDAVLVPVLGDHYGRVLEAGEIQLRFEQGSFTVRYYDHIFPVDPRSLSSLLRVVARQLNSDELAFLSGAYDRLPLATATDRESAYRRHRDQEVLARLLTDLIAKQPQVATAIGVAVQELNSNPDDLDTFLSLQNYRLAFWRITQGELGYRRFFDINSLIGLRMEDEQVFLDTHGLIVNWLQDGRLDGVRVDHPDGLRDPEEYFRRLQAAHPPAWIVIEKILEEGERLPVSWPVAGTTGYDFMNLTNGWFIDPDGENPLTDFYARFTGEPVNWLAIVREKKLWAAKEVLGGDLSRLIVLFLQITEKHRRYRDYTRSELRDALSEVAACFPVYRTYVRAEADEVHAPDLQHIMEAVELAKGNRADLDPDLFDFLRDILLLKVEGSTEHELVMRFQQFTGPVMAKGVEDTAFYVFNRLVSLNEVGGNPGTFGVSTEAYHEANVERQRRWPLSMLPTSTHDTKRSEDVRARLNVLSEIPEQWAASVERWAERNEPYRAGGLPDRNLEYLLYQTLVGAWPIEQERTLAYMEKAVREAKVHSSWRSPNPVAEEALANFVKSLYADTAFMEELDAFAARLVEPGWVNSIAQTLLKLTVPGVPDIYQGTELWDLSLVDPDNRRPVDYNERRRLLAALQEGLSPEEIWARAGEGLPKMWVICQALGLRRRSPGLFGPAGDYWPLAVRGTQRALAFARGEGAVTVVPRLQLKGGGDWGQAVVELPVGTWRNELTGDLVEGGAVFISQLLERFPVCLLSKEEAV